MAGFHAKAYLTKTRAVTGSANASINGLGQEDAANSGLEAAVEIDDEDAKIREWFEVNWDRADDVDVAVVKNVHRLWKLRTKPSLFAALVDNADLFKAAAHLFRIIRGRSES